MIKGSPWTGTGLGCFDAIFPLYREASVLQQRVLHPESDWLWLASEAGLLGLLAMGVLAGWMGGRMWRKIERGSDPGMQLALCVACLGVLAHSYMDVPGHRLGTMIPALLLLGLAVGGEGQGRCLNGVLRGAGAAVLALGIGALGVMALAIPVPVANGVTLLKSRATAAAGAGHIAQAESALGQALDWAPLDWTLYVERAQVEGRHGALIAALGDFRRARFLEPNYAGLPFDEGIYWLDVAPHFAVEAWEEALRRIPPERHAEYYQNMLAHAYPAHPDLHRELWAMAATDSAMELIYFGWATPEEFKGEIDELLHEDPGLMRFSKAELHSLFPIWMTKGDASQLASLLARRPEWLKLGYRPLAYYEASKGDLADAVDLMERYLPRPPIPAAPSMRDGEAERRFAEDNGDVAAGLALYNQAIAAGRNAAALEILQRLNPAAPAPRPAYLHYLEAQLWLKQGKNDQAWTALAQCPEADHP
jgi:hypothetical protein